MGRKRKEQVEAVGAPTEKPGVDFSIIFPSRGRPQLLKRLLDSIITTTKDIKRVEVIIAIDRDDNDTRIFLDKYCSSSEFVKYFIKDRSNNFSKDYYNFLYNHSIGKWVLAINDDAEFVTKDWDVLCRKALRDRDIIYGIVADTLGASLHGVKYSCWPLLGRRGCDLLGYYFPTRIATWGADIWAAKLYGAVDQKVLLPMTIKHWCHHNGTRERDELNVRVGNLSGVYSVEPTREEIEMLKMALSPTEAFA